MHYVLLKYFNYGYNTELVAQTKRTAEKLFAQQKHECVRSIAWAK